MVVEVSDEFDCVVGTFVSVGEGEEDFLFFFGSCFGEGDIFGQLVGVVGSLLGEGVEVCGVLASFAQPEGMEFDGFFSVAAAVFRGQVGEDFGWVCFDGEVGCGGLLCHGGSAGVWVGDCVAGFFWQIWGGESKRKIGGVFRASLRSVSASACLRFLAGALHRGRHGLCMMTGAKHRVRSKHHGRALQATRYGGARGSNPSQKTPRQRGEFIPSRTKCAFLRA